MTKQRKAISRLSDGGKHTLISAMGLWGQGDELAIEVTARQGNREFRYSELIALTEEQLQSIEAMVQKARGDFEEKAVDLRGDMERGE